MISYKMLGIRIRKARQKLNISSDKLAELMSISPSYIRRIENGSEEISFRRLLQISEILKESVGFFADGISVTHAEEGNYLFLDMVDSLSENQIALLLKSMAPIAEEMKKGHL